MMSPTLKQSTLTGVATEWCTTSSLCCYYLYSKEILTTKNSRKVFLVAFYKTDTLISFFCYGSFLSFFFFCFKQPLISFIQLALDYVLSCIVPLYHTCFFSSNLYISKRDYLTLLLKLSSCQHYMLKTMNLTWQVTSIRFPDFWLVVVLWSVFVLLFLVDGLHKFLYIPLPISLHPPSRF